MQPKERMFIVEYYNLAQSLEQNSNQSPRIKGKQMCVRIWYTDTINKKERYHSVGFKNNKKQMIEEALSPKVAKVVSFVTDYRQENTKITLSAQ